MVASPQNETGGVYDDTLSAVVGIRPVGRGADRRRILARQEKNILESAIAARRWATHQDDTCNGLRTPLKLYDIRLREFVVERICSRPVHRKGSRGSLAWRYITCNLDAA